MLSKIKFDISKLNTKITETGVTYTLVNKPNNLSEITGNASTKHNNWQDYKDLGEEFIIEINDEIEDGIWITSTLNFHVNLKYCSTHSVVDNYPGNIPNFVTDDLKYINSVLKDYIQNPNEEFVISVSEIYKEDQSETDGWQYYKWGQFIGDVNPDSDYLYDSTVHDLVYCVHVYKLEKK